MNLWDDERASLWADESLNPWDDAPSTHVDDEFSNQPDDGPVIRQDGVQQNLPDDGCSIQQADEPVGSDREAVPQRRHLGHRQDLCSTVFRREPIRSPQYSAHGTGYRSLAPRH